MFYAPQKREKVVARTHTYTAHVAPHLSSPRAKSAQFRQCDAALIALVEGV
jgi:hypothetical protein